MRLSKKSLHARIGLSEPLPLFVSTEKSSRQPSQSFSGDIEAVEHKENTHSEGGLLHNIFDNIGLHRYLTSQTESSFSKLSVLVYDSMITSDERYENNYASSSNLEFTASFESGNLEKVFSVQRSYDIPLNIKWSKVDIEYDLLLRNDINSNGNTQWYYFKASNIKCNRFPLKVRFNIINMRKRKSLYNFGKKPYILSVGNGNGWTNAGENICYYRNRLKYTLTFTYTFESIDEVYFASMYPYTYTDLQKYLHTLEDDERISKIIRRRPLCLTLSGNVCELITISAVSSAHTYHANKSKPAIVISSRIHPGESSSSYLIEGLISYLTSNSPEANLLIEMYTFNILPMLNPDGVINGNYRCSLAGCDLNRRFLDATEELHPTIIALKQLLFSLHYSRGVSLYLDFHGHSAKKNTLIYGCDFSQEEKKGSKSSNLLPTDYAADNARRVFSRLFPKILSRLSSHFSYCDSKFQIQLSKRGTGRVAAWKNVGIQASYTVEVSFCGDGNNREELILRQLGREEFYESTGRTPIHPCNSKADAELRNDIDKLKASYISARHYSQNDLRQIGIDIGKSIFHLSNLEQMATFQMYMKYFQSGYSGELFSQTDSHRDFGHLNENVGDDLVPTLPPASLSKPILTPAIFSADALNAVLTAADSISNIRTFCEMNLHRELGLSATDDFLACARDETSVPDEESAWEEDSRDARSEGSDSEPSADELSLKEILRRGGLGKLLKQHSRLLKVSAPKRKKSKRPSSAGSSRNPTKSSFSNLLKAIDLSSDKERSTEDRQFKDFQLSPQSISRSRSDHKISERLSRSYDKRNFTKGTESSLLKGSAVPPSVIPTDFQYFPEINQDGSPQNGSSTKTMMGKSPNRLNIVLKRRGVFFPNSKKVIN